MVAELDETLRRDALSLSAEVVIPLGPGRLRMIRKRVEIRGPNDVTWIGEVDGGTARLVLTVVNDALFGRIEIDGEAFLIERFGEAYSVFQEEGVNVGNLANDILVPDQALMERMSAADPVEDGSQIDLLVVYTSNLYNRYPTTLPGMIQHCVDVANDAYARSGINTRLRLVAAELYGGAGAAEGVDTCSALESFTVDPWVSGRRTAHKADLVSLFRLFNSGACGCAWIMQNPSPSFASSAFSVVEVRPASDANPYYCLDTTMAHELGHNLGCAHDRDHASVSGAYSYSYGYDILGVFATIMSYDSPRISYFSTPLVTYGGYPIGIAEGETDSADNARTINNTKLIASNFQIATLPDLSVTKAHLSSFVAGGVGEYSVTVRNLGSAPTSGPIYLEDTLPDDLSFVHAEGSGWDCNADGQLVACSTVQSLSPGASSSIRLLVATSAKAQSSIMNVATVSCDGDASLSNNSSADVVPLIDHHSWLPPSDFNGDGRTDLAGRVLSSGDWWVALSTGTDFTNQFWGVWAPTLTWVDVLPGDFNGDGSTDLVGRVLSTGDWWVALSTGSSFTNQYWGAWAPTVTWVDVLPGDFNGDGRTDLAGRVLSSGDWWIALSTGSSFTNQYWGAWAPTVTWVDVLPGDFNGDRRTDLAGRVLSSGDWWIALSTGSSFTNQYWGAWAPTVTWVDVLPGDFNADGRTDLSGRVSSSGDWWVGVSTGTAFTNQHWGGWSSAVEWVDVMPSDFNGDGRTDLAGRVSVTGDWWLAISAGTSFANQYAGGWSSLSDWVDVSPGYYNSDANADMIGRVASNGAWFALVSSGATFNTSTWGMWLFSLCWIDVH